MAAGVVLSPQLLPVVAETTVFQAVTTTGILCLAVAMTVALMVRETIHQRLMEGDGPLALKYRIAVRWLRYRREDRPPDGQLAEDDDLSDIKHLLE